MVHSLRLEVFETPEVPETPALMLPDQIEELRLAAYERGYLAGWEDAGTREDADAALRRTAIERTVERLDFSYHEARGHVLSALRPLFAEMIATLLPAAVRASLVPMVVDTLMPLATAAAAQPITLRIPAGQRAAFEAALAGLVLPPLDLVETAALIDGQAEFAFGNEETRVDLEQAARLIGSAIAQFYQIQTEEKRRA